MKASLITILFFLSLQSAYSATYSVPVANEYKEYAQFELNEFKSIEYDKTTTIKYQIPIELTGIAQTVEFSGAFLPGAEMNILTGPNGTLSCSKEVVEKMECKVAYTNLKFDEKKAALLIHKASSNPSETLGRLFVMRAFSSDPVGIIHY